MSKNVKKEKFSIGSSFYAEYGDYLISNLSRQLESEFGSGFSYRQLAYWHQFYKVYPIMHVLRAQLGEKLPDENPTVGILLCAAKNNTLVKLTLPKENTNILTSKYQFYLPSEEAFLEEIKDVIELAERTPVYE